MKWITKKPVKFTYTGKPQKLELDTGTFKFECYGAQGGGGEDYMGGFGGISIGVFTAFIDTTLWMYIGGMPSGAAGGWNGGGSGAMPFGGGGATDISRYGGEWNSVKHLYSRIIVAGGGGGGQYDTPGSEYMKFRGGHGGGVYGKDGLGNQHGYGAGPNYPGPLSPTYGTAYGARMGGFGYGGDNTGWAGESVGCGGSGWYGGSAGGGAGSNGSGGGGSGYVYCNSRKMYYPNGCLLDDTFLLAEPEMYDASNTGNGYIVITKLNALSERRNTDIYKDVSYQETFDLNLFK